MGIGKVFLILKMNKNFLYKHIKMNLLRFKPVLFSTIIYFGLSCFAIAQSDCTVKMKELKGNYNGDCKKGLAHGTGTAEGKDKYQGEFKKGLPHGNGIYTWSNGIVYDGEFKNGEKNGEGKMTIVLLSEKDSLLTGFWNHDKYVGKHKNPFKVHSKSPLMTGARVTASEDDKSIIYITINLKGRTESNPDFVLQEQVGSYSSIQSFGRVTKVYVVRYPFRFTLKYLDETADIEIFNEGAWNITIDINK